MEVEERNQIASLIQLVESEELAELSIQIGQETVCIRRGEGQGTQILRQLLRSGIVAADVASSSATPRFLHQNVEIVATPGTAGFSVTQENPASSVAENNPNLVRIISPMVGIFYRAAAPGAEPFVEVGSMVEEGQTIGLVEAMKVFNEIVAEVDGKVVAIPAMNEQLVQHGDTLVIIERMDF